jgi:NADH-quinone oxidoreductase subunit A
MQFDLANILVFAALGAGFLGTTLLLGSILRPQTPDPEKLGIYECGEKPIQQAWFNFNPRFYIVALIFLIFDVEVAFTYPVAVVFRRWVAEGAGGFAFIELALFVGILMVGLAYVWRKGDLEWIRRLKHDKGFEVEHRPDEPVRRVDAPTSHEKAA